MKGIMKRTMFVIPLVTLVACGNNDSAVQDRNANPAKPLGYYSNEKGNEVDIFDDREGAVTEIMDHSFGLEAQVKREQKRTLLQQRDENGNPPNPNVPLSDHDQFYKKDYRFSTGDANYHGHLDDNKHISNVYSNTPEDEKLAQRVGDEVESVKNVESVRSIIFGQSVEISVKYKNPAKKNQTNKEIRNAVHPFLNGRKLDISEDEGILSRPKNPDYQKNNGY